MHSAIQYILLRITCHRTVFGAQGIGVDMLENPVTVWTVMDTMVRLARREDLETIISLYRHLNPEDRDTDTGRLEAVWSHILSHGDIFLILIAQEDETPVASCSLSFIPNLTRGGRPIAFIENVITHPDYRMRGHATRLLQEAVRKSWERGCYKVVLMSNVKRTDAHRLYERVGFRRDTKFGFEIRRD
jgi:predicted GNAT family acetyltransferase